MNWRAISCVFRREFSACFSTPLAWIFSAIFLFLSGVFTFYLGYFYERGQADLRPFFQYHPWLYLFLASALSMRIWAEERASGNIELLLTLPLSRASLVLGKFFAAWCFCGVVLLLSIPMWITANYLGEPDNGVIIASYAGSWLMAGGFIAIGCCLSALVRSPTAAFLLVGTVCFVLLLSGHPLVQDLVSGWAPAALVEAVSSLGFLPHYNTAVRGVISLRDLLYYFSLITAWLIATAIVLDRVQTR